MTFSSPPWIADPDSEPFWVGVREASKRMKVSPVTLYRWIANGFVEHTLEIPVYRLGKRIFLRLSPHYFKRS